MKEHYIEILETSKEYKKKLRDKVLRLKKERNAYIVAHNYQNYEIQEIADILGDSLALSKAAIGTGSDVIVFCGVDFMAESAKILNPDKKVLLPVREADCPMALMATPERLREKKKEYPNAAVVCYVNSSAEVKAESDIACTSANAVQIVKSLPQKQILFVPDKNLGHYVQRFCPDKEIILWNGFCTTHIRVTVEDILKAKAKYPKAPFIAHPECPPDVINLADYVCSTSGFSTYIGKSIADTFIIGTEVGMIYKLKKDHPTKRFVMPTEQFVCQTMKMTTLGWVAHALEAMEYNIEIPEPTRVRAEACLRRMMDISKDHPNAVIASY
ncbi:MAG: quinolinate synthase [Candidatus Omnitrophica bacterium CG1_02_46_14]|nr:MAG: quinolinate synthase [Candidatus Omnitrophica bacterium CG1_02_46_14]